MRLFLAVLLAAAAVAAAEPDAPAAGSRKKGKTASRLDGWDSLKMEGSAVLGELKMQSGDYSEAHKRFGKSIETSVGLHDPSSPVMALDLYRSAELAAHRGDVGETRSLLEILLSRYPDSDFTRKAERLLALLERGEKVQFEEEGAVRLQPQGASPGSKLSRVRAALREGQWRDALSLTREFLESNPKDELAGEARLLEGLLYLQVQPAKAAPVLTQVARGGPPALRSRAAYALGAAAVSTRNCDWLDEDLRETRKTAVADRWQQAGTLWEAACDALSGRPASSEEKYRSASEALRDSAGRAYALAALAQFRDGRGEFGPALRLMDEAVSEADKFDLRDVSVAASLARGHLLYKMRRFPDAARAYQAFAAAYPDDVNATQAEYYRGLALKWAGDKRQAVRGFESLLARNPDTAYAPDARLQLGLLYGELGKPEKAAANYREMASGGKDSARESILLEAQLHYNRKRYRQAIPLYWRFIEEYPDDARRKEVATLLLTSYWQGAKDDPGFVKAAELFPDHPLVVNLRWNLAAQAHRQGQCEAAVSLLLKFHEEYPQSPRNEEGLMLRGECQYELREFRAAAGSFSELIKRFPKSRRVRDAWFKKGLALHEAGEFAASAASLRQVRGSDSLAADAAYNAALADVRSGHDDKALSSLERLVASFPKHPRAPWAFFKLGELREAAGQPGPAAAAYARASENRAQALFNMGRCYEKLKKRALAKKAYESLLKVRPAGDAHRVSGLARLGLFYEMDGRPRRAAAVYADVLKNAPPGEALDTARKRMLSLTRDGSLINGK